MKKINVNLLIGLSALATGCTPVQSSKHGEARRRRDNFKLTASEGGKHDDLIESESLRSEKVLFSIEEAQGLGLEIDHDDSHAYASDKSFAPLLHGTQRKETLAAKAMSALRIAGFNGYSQKTRRKQTHAPSDFTD
jgi:hypothetical protein